MILLKIVNTSFIKNQMASCQSDGVRLTHFFILLLTISGRGVYSVHALLQVWRFSKRLQPWKKMAIRSTERSEHQALPRVSSDPRMPSCLARFNAHKTLPRPGRSNHRGAEAIATGESPGCTLGLPETNSVRSFNRDSFHVFADSTSAARLIFVQCLRLAHDAAATACRSAAR